MHKQPQFRVAFIRQRYDPYGGAEKFLNLTMESLQKNINVEVTLITRRWNKRALENEGIKVLVCNPFFVGRLWRDWSFANGACKIVKRGNFDIVQSHERIPCGDIYRAGDGIHKNWLKQKKKLQGKVANFLTRISPYHNYLLFAEKNNFLRSSLKLVIANSNITASEIKDEFPKIASRIKVIPNAVDLTLFSPKLKKKYRKETRNKYGITDQKILSIFIGSGYERKGVNQLLAIFSKLPENHVLLIIGKDRKIKKYQKTAIQQGLQNSVIFIGPQTDIKPFLGAADIFLFPSLYDPLPNSALEAVATGLPVLASSTTGAGELTALFGIEPPDPYDTHDWVRKILELSTKLPTRKISLDRYTPVSMVNNLLSLYKSILDKNI